VHLPQLRRIRWAVRAALTLGVAASVAANVLHALPNPISQAIAAWPPLALLLTVELTSRIPMYRRSLAGCRVFATIAIAGIAAWVSYWHMASVAARYGETHTSAYLLPISVDGLIVVASVSLVELAGRIRVIEDQRAKVAAAAALAASTPPPVPVPPTIQFREPGPIAVPSLTPAAPLAPVAAPVPVAEDDEDDLDEDFVEIAPVSPAVAPVRTPAHVGQFPLAQPAPVSPAVVASRPAYVNGSTPPSARSGGARAAVSTPTRAIVTAPTRPATDPSAPRPRRPKEETAELADEIEAMHPEISQTELARRLGISPTRLRAVRREARDSRRASTRR
jgi:Protein of unknown function (DUF2637)